MVIFVVAIPKTIPCKRLPLKAASVGTPALLDVTAVGFGDIERGRRRGADLGTNPPPRSLGDQAGVPPGRRPDPTFDLLSEPHWRHPRLTKNTVYLMAAWRFPEGRFGPVVTVGTIIADRPPAQIRTCAFTHTTLTEDEWRRSAYRGKEPRKNNFTLADRATWRRHSCRPRPDSSGRLPGVLQSPSRGVGTRQSESPMPHSF